MITALPVAIPATTPEVLTGAIVGALLLHVPPDAELVSVVTELWQTLLAPDIVPTLGSGDIVMKVLATPVPQEVVTE